MENQMSLKVESTSPFSRCPSGGKSGLRAVVQPLRALLRVLMAVLVLTAFGAVAQAQSSAGNPRFTFSGDADVVSKYIWRGQRLTNDWSFQPAGTVEYGGFSLNVWGNLDLTAVNEGDSLLIPENPLAPSGARGLRGKFSEVDYTFSFSQSVSDDLSFDVGSIIYTFPERSASLPSTVEIYGGVSLDSLPLAPSATLYVDVDETRRDGGSTGVYFELAGGHSIPFHHPVFPGLDLSGWISFANSGFCRFYYGVPDSGAHDVNFTISLPMRLGERWSASAFVAYSGLLGEFRQHQLQDPRAVYRGTAGSPATYADTVWGGFTLNLGF